MKLNITPGPWIFSKGKHNGAKPDPNSIGSIQGTTETLWCIAEIQGDCAENGLDGQEESEANSAAIVTAVNNTYHKGINPEAVPEMLECIKMSVAIFEATGIKDTSGIGGKQYNKIKQATQKATL